LIEGLKEYAEDKNEVYVCADGRRRGLSAIAVSKWDRDADDLRRSVA
jgi:hypothetical protein